MKKDTAIKYLENKYEINHILANSLLSKTKEKTFTDFKVEEIFNIYKEAKSKPFVKWVGGKRQLLKQFKKLNLYPPRNFNVQKGIYFEPFVGGGAVFLDLLPKNAVLSDMNFELVTADNIIKK